MILRILFAAVAAVAVPLMLAVPPVPATAAAAAPDEAEVRMGHISVTAVGVGSPVVLIPGLSTPRAVWDGVVPDLARHHRVYLVQVNGFAGDDPGANVRQGVLAGVVADLHAFVTERKLGRPAVVGHSLGGLAGLIWAKDHPEDIGRLMVVDAFPFAGVMFAPTATVAMIEPQAKAIRDAMIASYGGQADDALIEATAARLALKPDSQAKVAAWSRASDSRVSGLALYDDLTTDLRPEMAKIATPITLVYPWSAALPKAQADALYHGEYAAAPNVTYVPVADSAHFVMLDQPVAFAAALDAFLGD